MKSWMMIDECDGFSQVCDEISGEEHSVVCTSGQIFPWRMTAKDYYRSMSGEMITEKRLKRLDKMTNVQLRELAQLLKTEKRAGYQEHLMDLMVEDIKVEK